jgi:beta-glucosidase-like glycosyl hydrolase/CubicO group peptidase (beta-lactamase class C family)
MKKHLVLFFFFSISFSFSFGQYKSSLTANNWVDSVFNSLTKEQRIAQLIMIRAHSNLGEKHVTDVTDLINKYDVGGLCFFQGGPVRQANLTNYYQSIAKTPLLIAIDGEWGVGMRLDSVITFPRQLMLGAVPDAKLIYEVGRAIGQQCKRLGIHINFAPDVDVNNNPNNPVINDRSFGENKYKVALYGIQYMKGMRDAGVMGSAKHFPGHGDVDVDSHYDLPVINKTREQLDSLELYPFQQIIKEGIGSVMIAHLYIPAIDNTPNQATSLSYKNVTGLLRNELGFKGLTFTDALEMKGVTKFYPAGEAALQSLIAGNDIILLPGDVEGSIEKVLQALKEGKLKADDIDARVKKVLRAKHDLGLKEVKPVETTNIVNDLNATTLQIKNQVANNGLTLLKQSHKFIPLTKKRLAFIGIGTEQPNALATRLKQDYNVDLYTFAYKRDLGTVPMMAYTLQQKYDMVLIGMHGYSRVPKNNFGISDPSLKLINLIQSQMPAASFVFGNPYAIKNVAPSSANLIAGYEDNDITQLAAADMLQGKVLPKGKLPVTVSPDLHFGAGIAENYYFPHVVPDSVGLDPDILHRIDSIANDAVEKKAAPGCVVLVAKDGQVAFHRSYGYANYDSIQPVNNGMIYDLASVTKISATTVAIMKLYEDGKLDLKKTLGDYLPWVKGSDKENLVLEKILLHQAGLVSFIPFYRETYNAEGPSSRIYSRMPDEQHQVRVAEDLYLRNDYQDTLYQKILSSKLSEPDKYIYSDNDFIFLGKIVEAVAGKKFEDYVRETFYEPLRMTTTGFKPREHFSLDEIAPTELDKEFRQQQLRGDVHDQGAAMFGGVAGHAGLFSNAYDLAQLYQLLLNRGELNGVRLFRKETIDYFTAYHSDISRRGFGFDKPEKDNATSKTPYPTLSASPATYGHTGFTGTCVWVDPKYNLIYIFLSNRVAPNDDVNRLLKLNVRSNIHETIYQALKPVQKQDNVIKSE